MLAGGKCLTILAGCPGRCSETLLVERHNIGSPISDTNLSECNLSLMFKYNASNHHLNFKLPHRQALSVSPHLSCRGKRDLPHSCIKRILGLRDLCVVRSAWSKFPTFSKKSFGALRRRRSLEFIGLGSSGV